MKMAHTGLLLREQAAKPLLEFREVVIAPVGYRHREIGAVLPLEHEHGSGMVKPKAFDHGHRSTVHTTLRCHRQIRTSGHGT